MIVKNEQDWIEKAVESVRSIVQEVIIVDTGSTDSTPARARALGARLIEIPWPDSFADARNISIEAATQPWILVLDADERIAARDLPRIEALISSGGADGYHLIQRNYVFQSGLFGWIANANEYEEGAGYGGYVDNPLIRLFRNSPQIRFRGSVHEIIDPPSLPQHLRFGSTATVIHHYGKVRNQEYVVAKQRFYLQLGLKKVTENPANGKAHLDLGIQYQELGHDEEACACFDSAFDLMREATVLVYWAISEKKLRNYHSAAGLLNHAVELGLDSFEVHLELGNVHLAQHEWPSAQAEYAKCLSLRPSNPVPAFNQGLALRKMGDTERAIEFYNLALRLDPSFREPMLELAVLHLRNNKPDEALQLLKELRDADANVLTLIGTAHLQKGDLDEAQKHLEEALRKNRRLADARLNLAQVFARKGDHARAARYTQSVGTL